MSCDPSILTNAAKCFQCLNQKQLLEVSAYLLCQIAGNSSQQLFAGSGAPTTEVPAFDSGVYYDYTNQVQYNWNPVTHVWVATPAASGVPAGVIAEWHGTIATIPTGWALCDGANGTPDLRDKFIVCARQDQAGVAVTNIEGSLLQTGGSTSSCVSTSQFNTISVGGISGQAVAADDTSACFSVVNPYFALAYIMKL